MAPPWARKNIGVNDGKEIRASETQARNLNVLYSDAAHAAKIGRRRCRNLGSVPWREE